MGKCEEAQEILKALGLPVAQQNEISALTLLALCGLKENDNWKKTFRQSLTITKGIMRFIAENYGKAYAPNTRETFRRQELHQFIQAGIVDYNPDNPDLPTNSPSAHYALNNDALAAMRSYGSRKWKGALERFLSEQGSLILKYQKNRTKRMIPVTLADGTILSLSPGKHNRLQSAIIEEFAPRFAPGAIVLYIGDTAKKNLIIDEENFKELCVVVTDHDKLPDVVLFDSKRNWLLLIEAVTSHGPVTPKRMMELDNMLSQCAAGKVYVSAFPDFAEFRKHIKEIAWETEVWIAEFPDHMIHYNGE
ncbi:MAG: BsuBI/PstI family type II restriction endonuclease [bacterium]